MRITYKLILLFTFGTAVFAQAPDTLWTKRYGNGGQPDMGHCVSQTQDGGYIIIGSTRTYGAGNFDFWLLKTDENGDTLWTKTFGDQLYDLGWSGHQTIDKGYIIVGHVANDAHIVKTDSLGNMQWSNSYGGGDSECFYSVRQTLDSAYVATGFTKSFTGNYEVVLVKFNSDGDTLWAKRYFYGIGFDLDLTSDTGCVITGWTGASNNREAFIIKTDADGDTVWTKRYDAYTEGLGIEQTYDGGYILTGDYSDTTIYALLIKTDANGDTVWTKRYGEISSAGWRVRQTADEGYILAGFTGAGTDRDIFVLKTNTDGDSIWAKRLGGNNVADEGYDVQQTSDSCYIITGFHGGGGTDVYIAKLDSDMVGKSELADISADEFQFPVLISGPLRLPKGKNCRVFDITGQVVIPQHITPGVYFIEVDGEIRQKVVKIR